jgi:succinate dehydrogenase/fumarate reductase-like Fe-S protein
MDDAVKVKDDDSDWKCLFRAVLVTLTSVMESADQDSDFIGPQTVSQAERIIDDFGDENFREWKEEVEKGIKHDDWEGLLEHRTCQT